MIYTVTLNPALDYVVKVPDFKPGAVNRTAEEAIYPGGKGINVSVILSRLGAKNTALGFAAGFTGAEIERLAAKYGCGCDFVWVQNGLSRICVKVLSGEETELNGQGPAIAPKELSALFDKLAAVRDGDMVVLAGSIPAALPADIYEQMLERLSDKAVTLAVDTTGKALKRTLPYRPFLIKPNLQELGALFNATPRGDEEIVGLAERLVQLGAQNVLVSLGGDGALLVTKAGEAYRALPPKGTVVYTVGAGDSMVAGFLKGYAESGSCKDALALAVAAGSATAYSPWLAEREDILRLRALVTVDTLQTLT